MAKKKAAKKHPKKAAKKTGKRGGSKVKHCSVAGCGKVGANKRSHRRGHKAK